MQILYHNFSFPVLKISWYNQYTMENKVLFKKVNIPLLILAFLMIGATLFFAYYSRTAGILYVKTNGNPVETVDSFFTSFLEGDYAVAYSYLKDYTSLGIESIPEDEASLRIYNALLDSYSYSTFLPSDEAFSSKDAFTSTVNVSFSSLDVSLLDEDIASQITPLLEECVATMSRHDLYDEAGNYKSSLLNDVYEKAFTNTLSRSDSFLASSCYEVQLEYVDDRWLIIVNEDMINGFLGRYAHE